MQDVSYGGFNGNKIRNWMYTGSQTKINGMNIVDERRKKKYAGITN